MYSKPAQPKTVVYLIDSLGSGGAQRQFVELVKGLDRNMINPVVVIYHDLQHYKDHLVKANVPVNLLKKRDKIGLTFFWKFHQLLKELRPALIHSYLNTPNFYARLAKALGDTEHLITSERNAVLTRFDAVLEKMVWRISDRIIVNAEKTIDTLANDIGVTRERIVLIPNGINVDLFSHPNTTKVGSIREGLSIANGELLIGVLGRICEQKGQIFLVEACHLIQTKFPSFKFKVCFWGAEDEKKYCDLVCTKIALYNLQHSIIFGGVEADVASVLAACDLVILPSLWEGFPNALLETMAAARPAIATRIADNEKIVSDGETGFLVGPGNPDDLAKKILFVSGMDTATKAEIGRRGRDLIDKEYGIQRLVEKTMQVYSDIGVL